jgi:1-acyl-sn-glycerol-3-phosphate acyltransferase
VVRAVRRWLSPLVRLLFRPTLTGLEHLPTGPCLWVANHSAGLALAESVSFLSCYLTQVGPERPLAAVVHPLGFRVVPALWGDLGFIPSTYEALEATLRAGVPVLIFPGGDHEAMRPVWQAHRVDFGGRRGFLKVARALRVPVVPMGIRGSHFTAPVLWRSRWVLPRLVVWPWLLGVKRWPLTLLGLLGAVALAVWLPWAWPARALAVLAWLGSPLVVTPIWPASIRFRVGPALPPEVLFTEGDEALTQALARVEAAVEALVRGP